MRCVIKFWWRILVLSKYQNPQAQHEKLFEVIFSTCVTNIWKNREKAHQKASRQSQSGTGT